MLAESLVIDLGLDQEPAVLANREQLNDRPYSYRFTDTMSPERTLEERRAYLGVLYIVYV